MAALILLDVDGVLNPSVSSDRAAGGHRLMLEPEREELVRLRRELRVAKMEIEILKRASAYFAQENVLPK